MLVEARLEIDRLRKRIAMALEAAPPPCGHQKPEPPSLEVAALKNELAAAKKRIKTLTSGLFEQAQRIARLTKANRKLRVKLRKTHALYESKPRRRAR